MFKTTTANLLSKAANNTKYADDISRRDAETPRGVFDRINKIDRIKKGQANEEENGVPDENLD